MHGGQNSATVLACANAFSRGGFDAVAQEANLTMDEYG